MARQRERVTYTEFVYRGVPYTVSGWLWSDDGDRNGIIVHRLDGKPIRGAKIHPGMIQIGLSQGLEDAATQALQDADDEAAEKHEKEW